MKYYTTEEVGLHCTVDDVWVTIFDKVFDITKLVKAHSGPLADPLIKHAGSSISHLFEKNMELKTYIDPVRNIRVPYTPDGRFVHVPPNDPTEWDTSLATPWWKDKQYIIGRLTLQKKQVNIVNVVTKGSHTITVCMEDTINDILDKYLEYNAHARSYTWKAIINDTVQKLDMSKTLRANGVADEDEVYIPSLLLYFNDDLTYA